MAIPRNSGQNFMRSMSKAKHCFRLSGESANSSDSSEGDNRVLGPAYVKESSMKANTITGTLTIAAVAMISVHGGSISAAGSAAGLWLGLHAPAFIFSVLWQDLSCLLATVHACAWLGTMLLMTVIAGTARR